MTTKKRTGLCDAVLEAVANCLLKPCKVKINKQNPWSHTEEGIHKRNSKIVAEHVLFNMRKRHKKTSASDSDAIYAQ
ncbi:hypothetical protein SAY87_007368 [Trapa incisa]|uniref:Uncharacterized protein n=2 Tax=Trapa TaxID=22665 RepID=A0AAN7QPT8_TRANT|nr:hypothetical protein SAY87_007368 [Trapa incisa]KAK4774529.1 hypothetical protein SAY86_009464 [Trapa natans]